MELRPILSTLRRHKTAAALIVIEIALTCTIICDALFIVSQRWDNLHQTSSTDEHALVVLCLSGVDKQANVDALAREDVAALRAIPGVTGVAMVNQLPFQGGSDNSSLHLRPDQPVVALNGAMYTGDEGAVRTLGLHVIARRDFLPGEYQDWSALMSQIDGSNGTPLRTMPMLISHAAAEKAFPGQSAVGRRVYIANIPLLIVGVVEQLRRPNREGGNTSYSMLLPLRQNYTKGAFYVLRVRDPALRAQVLDEAQAAVERVAPNRLVMTKETFDARRERYFNNDRDMMTLLITLCVALLVTALGIVGLASFWVGQRRHQIGVRRALGATRGQILRYFQTENFLLASTGIALGMVLAYAINQLLMSHYELPRLPLAYLPVDAIALWLLGQIAVLGPARRAAAVPDRPSPPAAIEPASRWPCSIHSHSCSAATRWWLG